MMKAEKQSFWQSLGSFGLTVMIIMALRWCLVEPFVIPSGSMIPSLLIHDHILVQKYAYGLRVPWTKIWFWRRSEAGPKRGDVVVFRDTEGSGIFLVKRVIGLPGDRLSLDPQGRLYINSEAVDREPLTYGSSAYQEKIGVREKDLEASGDSVKLFWEELPERPHGMMQMSEVAAFPFDTIEVPAGHYFTMGDNRDRSRDSRAWGFLPEENLMGRAAYIWLSCEESLPIIHALCNPFTMRWDRIFKRIQ